MAERSLELVVTNMMLREDVVSLNVIIELVHVEDRIWPDREANLQEAVLAIVVEVKHVLEDALMAMLIDPLFVVLWLISLLIVVHSL